MLVKFSFVFCFAAVVLQSQAVDLAGIIQRNKVQKIGAEAVFGRQETRVSDPVVTLVGIEFSLSRLPAGIPYLVLVCNIIILSVGIIGDIVVAVTSNSEHLGILVKAVAATGVGND